MLGVMEIGVYYAKTRLAELIRLVEAGKRVVITRRGEPVACLVPYESEDQ